MRLLGGSGEAARAVSRQRRFHLARLGLSRLRRAGRRVGLSLARKACRPRLELDFLEVAHAVEHAVGEGLLVGERAEHAVLDGLLGDEIDDGDRAGLVFAPGAGDALLQLGGVPGQVAVDDDAGVLEVQARGARIGAEKDAAIAGRT